MTTIDAVRDPHWAVVLQILSPRSSSLRSGPSLALERGFPATSRNELKDGCTTLKWNRWRDVGQAGSLRATQRVPRLPPLSAAIAAVGRLTIGRSLPSCPTGAPPAWRTTYAQMQALLLMNRLDVHFHVAYPRAVPPAGWHVTNLIIKEMYRIALFALAAAAAFAQTDVPPAETPPAEVDQALRARVNEFYILMQNHEYRKGEAMIAEDTKDYYYAGSKPEIHQFEVLSIEYSGHFTHAKVTTRCSQPLVVAGFPPGEISLKIPTLWKIDNGNWYLYEDPEKIHNPSGLQTKIQSAVNEAAAKTAQLSMPKEISQDPSFVLGKVQVDKAMVKLAPGTAT